MVSYLLDKNSFRSQVSMPVTICQQALCVCDHTFSMPAVQKYTLPLLSAYAKLKVNKS